MSKDRFPITKETFGDYNTESKLNTIFDLMLVQHECSCNVEEKVDNLKTRYEKRKKIDTTISGLFGFVGGATAVVIKAVFGGK